MTLHEHRNTDVFPAILRPAPIRGGNPGFEGAARMTICGPNAPQEPARLASIESLGPLPMEEGENPVRTAARITRASGSSFGPGMALLPRPRREAMRALYAFSRVIDDIADEDWPLADKHRLLKAWREEIEELYRGRPVSAIGHALMPAIARYDLPKEEFLALIDGMRMDADGPVLAPSMEEFSLYCRRVAGAVGILSMRIFGAWQGAASERFALALGDAFQFTNILRDIEEDAELGRLYLPREILEEAGLPLVPDAIPGQPGLVRAGELLGAMARREFERARAEIPAHNRLALTPALMMMGVYETYLARIEASGFQRGDRPKLSKREKVMRGISAILHPMRPQRA